MNQEEINLFIDNFKYFKAILAQCFNSPTSSLQSVSILAQTPNPQTRWCNTWTLPHYIFILTFHCLITILLYSSQITVLIFVLIIIIVDEEGLQTKMIHIVVIVSGQNYLGSQGISRMSAGIPDQPNLFNLLGLSMFSFFST